MSWIDNLFSIIADKLAAQILAQTKTIETTRKYRTGEHPRQLKKKDTQTYDDNTTLNLTGLIVNRGVSNLLGDGIEFDLPGGEETVNTEGVTQQSESAEQEYLEEVWELSKQQILLTKACLLAADGGTGYLKIIPGGSISKDGLRTLPRLVTIDPEFVIIDTLPQDMDIPIRYTIAYIIKEDWDGKERAYKEVIENVPPEVDPNGIELGGNYWLIHNYILDERTHQEWQEIPGSPKTWEFDFPPMDHWQNLPDPKSVYGQPDLTPDIQHVQDRINFIASNISKLIRLYAHPMRFANQIGDFKVMDIGPDKMVIFETPDGKITQLGELGDLASSIQFQQYLRQTLFDISRSVDIDSIGDKLGALTNFALHVLYQDAIAKINTKRTLLEECLNEINRRLLILGAFPNTDPGHVVWPEILPTNSAEELSADLQLQKAGIESKETIATKNGLDWEQEKQKIAADNKAADERAQAQAEFMYQNPGQEQ